MKYTLQDIRHTKDGFEALIRLYTETKDLIFENINIDMQKVQWLDADMCAAFGAILYRLSDNINAVKLINLDSRIETILAKNGFLSHYGNKKILDKWGTTISYQRFDAKDDRYFVDYIEKELTNRPEIPDMSAGLSKKFQESIFEIFGNAVSHSQSKLGIFSCGQFFPARNHLVFSIVDLGIGIQQNINNIMGLDLAPDKAIIWATIGNNTTKTGQVPGGLGLKLLCEFIDLNNGCIQIVSDAGYWKREKGRIETAIFYQSFPGTAVNIKINTADKGSYRLSTEITDEEIF